MFDDVVTRGIELALDGVAERQRVASANIANAATPGYRAKRVAFESDLAAALATGDPGRARVSTDYADTPARADGNTVALEEETTSLIKSGLQYQSLIAALNFKLSALRSAVNG